MKVNTYLATCCGQSLADLPVLKEHFERMHGRRFSKWRFLSFIKSSVSDFDFEWLFLNLSVHGWWTVLLMYKSELLLKMPKKYFLKGY